MNQSIETFPYPLIALKETASTNQYLSSLCDHNQTTMDEFTTVTAEYQTAGKGQRGNSWEASPGQNLLCSVLLYPTFLEARRQFLLSQVISIAIKEALDSYCGGITIKWPNDIYWQEKKICGILIENELGGTHLKRTIVGIGLNINQERFLSDAPNPVSLKQITGETHDCGQLLCRIMQRIVHYYRRLQTDGPDSCAEEIAARYGSFLFRRHGLHPYEDIYGKFTARLLRVEPDGRFVLEDEGGQERSYLFKEVQYLL